MISEKPESEWIQFAELVIDSGKIAVSDPMYWCDLPPCPCFDIRPGIYCVHVKIISWIEDQRVSRLRVSRQDGEIGTVLDNVSVDFAQVGVFDPALLGKACEAMSKQQEAAVVEEFNGVRFHSIAHFDDSLQANMPFVTSGFGDGRYPIFELCSNGERVGLEIVFIGSENEPED